MGTLSISYMAPGARSNCIYTEPNARYLVVVLGRWPDARQQCHHAIAVSLVRKRALRVAKEDPLSRLHEWVYVGGFVLEKRNVCVKPACGVAREF